MLLGVRKVVRKVFQDVRKVLQMGQEGVRKVLLGIRKVLLGVAGKTTCLNPPAPSVPSI